MIKPWPTQIEKAAEAYEVLRTYGLVYIAMEERTGKSLTATLVAEHCKGVNRVLIATTRKAKDGWLEWLPEYKTKLHIDIATHATAYKLGSTYDLIIMDEAHKNISGFPKASTTQKQLRAICKGKPIVYLSATPHAQGYQLLYHQFQLSTWSPWHHYASFYGWFKTYGKPNLIWRNGRQVETYSKTDTELCRKTVEHLFVTGTRKELGFEHEPKDHLHYVELAKSTRNLYNEVLKHKATIIKDRELVCDTPMGLRCALHMIEGGGVKIDNEYIVLRNREKIDYILQNWGDTEDLVIFYHYKVEKLKLEKIFKRARILQAQAYAEGVDLSMHEHLVIYSQSFSTAQHTQRRARQANKYRATPINVHYMLVSKAISEQVYNVVSINKQNFVDSVFEREEL